VTVPALRGALNCSLVPSDRVTAQTWSRGNMLKVSAHVGTSCGDIGHNPSVTLGWAEGVVSNVTNEKYFGLFTVFRSDSKSTSCALSMAKSEIILHKTSSLPPVSRGLTT
jgi:hypothetical protein